MKSNLTQPTSITLESIAPKPILSRFSSLSRHLLTAVSLGFVSFAAVPQVQAARVNGSYEIKRVHGSLKAGGEKIDLPDRLAKAIVDSKHGRITIHNRKLDLDKSATIDIVEEYSNRYWIDVDASVKGPAYVDFEKVGNDYEGKADGKIVTRFDASIFGEDFSGVLKTKVSATVENHKLKIIIKYFGESEGHDFSGHVVIIAKR